MNSILCPLSLLVAIPSINQLMASINRRMSDGIIVMLF